MESSDTFFRLSRGDARKPGGKADLRVGDEEGDGPRELGDRMVGSGE